MRGLQAGNGRAGEYNGMFAEPDPPRSNPGYAGLQLFAPTLRKAPAGERDTRNVGEALSLISSPVAIQLRPSTGDS
ncbi:MAG: hypothetical protein V2G51_00355 [bacterium JZ-2024 1]